jgi:hypothetical protein
MALRVGEQLAARAEALEALALARVRRAGGGPRAGCERRHGERGGQDACKPHRRS